MTGGPPRQAVEPDLVGPAGDAVKGWSFHRTLLLYTALFFALTFPFWLRGEVIAPYGHGSEIGADEGGDTARVENHKFFDYLRIFVPEVEVQLHGKRSGWLSVWTDRNELGRPIDVPMAAYPPIWLLTTFIDDPWRILTAVSLGTCFLGGLFMLLLCRELGLSPLASLLAGVSFATSPVLIYWLTAPLFLAGWCWAVATLYGVTRLSRDRSLASWSVLSFGVFSLAMTAYQQDIVYHAYFFVCYLIVLSHRHWRSHGSRSTRLFLGSVATAVGAGALLALPTNLDLAVSAVDSARLGVDPSFFDLYLPDVHSWPAAARFLTTTTVPEIFGNPISPTYPLRLDGSSAPLLVTFLALCGLLTCLRRTWAWWLAVVVPFALALARPLHQIAVRFLGFNLSPIDPTGYFLVPLTIVAAYGADVLIRRSEANQYAGRVIVTAAGLSVAVLVATAVGSRAGLAVDWANVAMSVLVIGLLAAQADRTRPYLMIAAVMVTLAYVSFPLLLRQEPPQPKSSALVRDIQEHLPPDSRFAVAAPGIDLLLPNVNATVGLASIHSNNSISSRRYQELVRALGGETRTYGQWNTAIAPDYDGASFWMSNIGVMLSPSRLDRSNLEYLGVSRNVHLHRVVDRMGCCLQVLSGVRATPEGVQVGDPRLADARAASKTLDQGDLLEIEVQPAAGSVLVLSQRFHRYWHARALSAGGWSEAETAPVNGVFQGVLLADGVRRVQLRFEPYARLAWIAHVFWLAVVVVVAYQRLSAAGERG